MAEPKKTTDVESDDSDGYAQPPEIDSRFRQVIVAALRSKQLLRGARPRVAADPHKRRNTSIALEEVRRGLVTFTVKGEEGEDDGAGGRRG